MGFFGLTVEWDRTRLGKDIITVPVNRLREAEHGLEPWKKSDSCSIIRTLNRRDIVR